jgi:beta-xylosidase
MVSNPIVPGFNPDPSLIRVGSDYFLATSTFEYFPGVAIHHSKDLVNWKMIGHALNRPSQLNMRNVCPGGGIYAPTLRYWKGRFYVATSVVYDRPGGGVSLRLSSIERNHTDRKHQEPRGFYVSTDDIFDDSKWSEPVYFEMLGIDQDVRLFQH